MFPAMITLERFNGDYLIEKFGSNQDVTLATDGYFGFLIGSVLIGWMAEYIGLTYSFAFLLLLTAGALLLVRRQAASLKKGLRQWCLV